MNRDDDLVLDKEVIDMVADGFVSEATDVDRVSQLRARVMQRIDGENGRPSLFDTIRSNEGEWIEIMPNVEKKLLKTDHESGVDSYLLRMHPGATAPGHIHESDELCYVIEGELSFGDIHLKAGDYHYAYKGSQHDEASTVNGTLLFLQSGIELQPTI